MVRARLRQLGKRQRVDERAARQRRVAGQLPLEEGSGPATHPQSRTIGAPAQNEDVGGGLGSADRTGGGGKVLGTFRTTYDDFPSVKDFSGPNISLMNAKCQPIKDVPRAFYEAACVQGSGSLARGGTVSFAKRDCACAEVCPRTNQKICFDALDKQSFPWGRGAAGVPIAPLRSIAADTSVLPMGTVVYYLPELDGHRGQRRLLRRRGSRVARGRRSRRHLHRRACEDGGAERPGPE